MRVIRGHPARAYGLLVDVETARRCVMTAGAETENWWGSWWIPMVVGLISLVCGILALVWPDVTLLALALIAGINLCVLSAFVIAPVRR